MFGNKAYNLNVSLSLSEASLQRLAQLLAAEVACKVLKPIQDQATINNGVILNALDDAAASLANFLKGEIETMSTKSEQRLQQIANNLGVAFTDLAGRVNESVTKLRQQVEDAVKDSDSKADERLAAALEDEFATLEGVAGQMVAFMASVPEITTVAPDATAPDAPILPEVPVSVGGDTAVDLPASGASTEPLPDVPPASGTETSGQ